MKYLLMMHAPDVLAAKDMQASLEYMIRLTEDLFASGELISTEALAPPKQAKVVRAGQSLRPEVTDGPYPEAKEFLLGYWLIDCETPERAYEIAALISAVPGPGGVTSRMPIEVREVMGAPPAQDI